MLVKYVKFLPTRQLNLIRTAMSLRTFDPLSTHSRDLSLREGARVMLVEAIGGLPFIKDAII